MYELVQHTADIRVRVTARSREELFSEALRALTALVEPLGVSGERVTAGFDLEAADTTLLLIDFLNEVLTRGHVNREIYTGVTFVTLTETSAAGTLHGARVSEFGEDVKAVTYHEAEVTFRDGQWSTLLVLDV